jgi:hypothetical protein
MRSVADELRRQDAAALARLTANERLALAFALGDADIDAYCRTHGVTSAEAAKHFERQRQNGRTPSQCMTTIIG